MRWTPQEYEAYLRRRAQVGVVVQHSQSEYLVPDEPVAATEGKTESSGRIVVRIKSLRCRLLDPDNLCPKYVIDALRYAGAISNDRDKDIILEVSQEEVTNRAYQKTVVEITYP